MYATDPQDEAGQALLVKASTGFGASEGMPCPRVTGFGQLYDVDWWNRDLSDFLDVPPERDTATPDPSLSGYGTSYAVDYALRDDPAYPTGFGVLPGAIIAPIVGGLIRSNKDAIRFAANKRAEVIARGGNRAALTFLGQRGTRLPAGVIPGLDAVAPDLDGGTIGPWATAAAQQDAAAKYDSLVGGAAGGNLLPGTTPGGKPDTGGVPGSPNQPGIPGITGAGLFSGPVALWLGAGLIAFVLFGQTRSRRRARR